MLYINHAAVHGVEGIMHNWVTEQQQNTFKNNDCSQILVA